MKGFFVLGKVVLRTKYIVMNNTEKDRKKH